MKEPGPLFKIGKIDEMELYKKYRVKIKFRDKILGGIPKNPEMIKGWLAGRKVPKEEINERAEKIAEEVQATEEEKAWTGFKSDKKGIYIEPRQIRAMLKEAAFVKRMTRTPGFRDSINHGLFIKPEKIYLTRDGKEIKEPDGYEEKPIHVIGPRGKRTELKREDFVEKAEAEFEIWDATTVITKKDLQIMLTLGQEIGLGSSRSQDFGKFDIV